MALERRFASVNATADGDNTLVAAIVGRKIRVINYVLYASATGAANFTSGAGGTVLARCLPAVNGGASFAGDENSPAFETAAGAALVLNNGAGVDILGHLTYVLA